VLNLLVFVGVLLAALAAAVGVGLLLGVWDQPARTDDATRTPPPPPDLLAVRPRVDDCHLSDPPPSSLRLLRHPDARLGPDRAPRPLKG
jgi:hypothetical protein